MSIKMNLSKDKSQITQPCLPKRKKVKHWLYASSTLALFFGVDVAIINHNPVFTLKVQAATATMPSSINQIGSIGSAPLFQTADTSWSNLQKGVDALAQNVDADY